MDIIKNYTKALQIIYDHVGFVEDWVVYPLDDCTNKLWHVDETTNTVYYANTHEDFIDGEGNYFSDDIYTQRFYKKWVYRGEKYTMVFCDPHVDGMKYFRIFDNNNEQIKPPVLIGWPY
jgi:hypothetical protein